VQNYCAEIGVPYEQTWLIESYRQALAHLNAVGTRVGGREEPRCGMPRRPKTGNNSSKTARGIDSRFIGMRRTPGHAGLTPSRDD